MPILYVDVLVLLNWLIDYLLLSLTARLLRRPLSRFRGIFAAAVGGVTACRILLPLPPLAALLFHVGTAFLLVRIAFRWDGWRHCWRCVAVFYLVSALLSGLITALWYVTGSEAVLAAGGVVYWDISPLLLTVLTVVSYGAVWLFERLTAPRAPAALEYTVTVDDGGGCAELRALYDSGLHLREPFSGVPVILVRKTALLPMLSPALSDAVCGVGNGVTTAASPRLRMIPYRTVSGNGLLPAFVPKRVSVHRVGEPPRDVSGVYVALSDEPSGAYTALIGSDLWKS